MDIQQVLSNVNEDNALWTHLAAFNIRMTTLGMDEASRSGSLHQCLMVMLQQAMNKLQQAPSVPPRSGSGSKIFETSIVTPR